MKAEQVMKEWLEGLRKDNLDQALAATQVSWKFMAATGRGAAATLDDYRRSLLIEEIVSVGPATKVSPVCYDVKYEVMSDGQPRSGEARVWCESAPMKPNARGTWGVNPSSFFRSQRLNGH